MARPITVQAYGALYQRAKETSLITWLIKFQATWMNEQMD